MGLLLLAGSCLILYYLTTIKVSLDTRSQAAVPTGITTWATRSLYNLQGKTADGKSAVVGDRSNPAYATGAPNFEPTEGVNKTFYTLGKAGQVVFDFGENKVIDNVAGADLSIHEATTGDRTKYIEQAKVEVSQAGLSGPWIVLGTAISTSTDGGNEGVKLFDLNTAGLSWIKFVRLTDTTNFINAPIWMDGFDLDAVGAAKVRNQTAAPVSIKSACTSSTINNGSDPAYTYVNVASFNIGGSVHTLTDRRETAANSFADMIIKHSLDFVALQEVAESLDKSYRVNDGIVSALSKKGYPMYTVNREGGVTFLSKYPLTGYQTLPMAGGTNNGNQFSARLAITASTTTPFGSIRLFNHHQHIGAGCVQIYPYFYDLINRFNDKNMIAFGDLNSSIGKSDSDITPPTSDGLEDDGSTSFVDPRTDNVCAGGSAYGKTYSAVRASFLKFACAAGRACAGPNTKIDWAFIPKMPNNLANSATIYESCVKPEYQGLSNDGHYPRMATVKIAK